MVAEELVRPRRSPLLAQARMRAYSVNVCARFPFIFVLLFFWFGKKGRKWVRLPALPSYGAQLMAYLHLAVGGCPEVVRSQKLLNQCFCFLFAFRNFFQELQYPIGVARPEDSRPRRRNYGVRLFHDHCASAGAMGANPVVDLDAARAIPALGWRASASSAWLDSSRAFS